MNTELTTANIAEHVERTLGSSNVAVEVDAPMLLVAMKAAVRMYNRYRPRRSTATLNAVSGQDKYLINHTNVQSIVSVQVVPTTQLNASATSEDPFSQDKYYLGQQSLGDYALRREWLKNGRKVMSSEPEWKQVRDNTGALYLYIQVPPAHSISYTYLWSINPEYAEFGEYGIRWVDDTDLDWFYDYVTNRCRYMLGNALRKFGGVPDPTGSPQPLHGSDLVQESIVEEERLVSVIQTRRRPAMPTIG